MAKSITLPKRWRLPIDKTNIEFVIIYFTNEISNDPEDKWLIEFPDCKCLYSDELNHAKNISFFTDAKRDEQRGYQTITTLQFKQILIDKKLLK